MTDHPIAPPLELQSQWRKRALNPPRISERDDVIAIHAARWGADQELEACCEWLRDVDRDTVADRLRLARRPKPPSLKKQALEALDRMDQLPTAQDQQIIRRALEQLDD